MLDLQTGEGAIFRPGGNAHADLQKHRIWCCPLFEPFLEWLYKHNLENIDELPKHVDLAAEFELFGYRRPGPDTPERAILRKLVDTVIATGGFVRERDGTLTLAADDEWLDLADVAMQAAKELGIAVAVEDQRDDEKSA